MEFMKNESFAVESSDAKYAFEDGGTDDINNDSDTSSSFSLQECMNEFRARRIRRLCLTHRQDVDKKGVNDANCVAEIDLINQNLCNKEQERKFKPCKNGFCYCFTSDSGDGGKSHKFRKIFKNSRRNRRPVSNSGERTSNSRLSKDHIWYVKPKLCAASVLKSTTKVKSRLEAISTLETSRKDEPLIHITQELRDNCVLSKVKVNKHKIKGFGNNINMKESSVNITSQKKALFVDQIEAKKRNANDMYNPTAPDLETILDLETHNVTSQIHKHHSNISELRRSAGGQLLQKRLTLSNSSYKLTDIEKDSRSPPRIKIFSEDNLCESTSASVCKAEREVDDFLAKENINMNADIKLITGAMHSSGIRKSHPLTLSETYSSLSDVQNNMELKNLPHHDEIVKPAINNKAKVICVGWNKPKFKDIINDNVQTNNHEFHYKSYQPQQNPSTDIVRNEKSIGWQMPPQASLDTVDGIVHRNLLSNFEEKKTPRKNKLNKSSQNSKDSSRKLKFLWPEQLRHLSPWPKNCNVSEFNNSKHKLCSGSKAFIVSSKNKFLSLVSPKKDKDRHSSQIRKVLHRNVGVQTLSNDDLHNQSNIQSGYQHSSSPQSSPRSYHSPLQSPCIQNPILIDTENGNIAECNSSTNVHSLPKKVSRSSNPKLSFCRYCTFLWKEGTPQNIDISNSSECCNHNKTYRSFTSEIDEDVCISKISYVLSKIRAKLETNDEDVARTFLEETIASLDKEMEKINDHLYNSCPNTPFKKSDKCIIGQNPSRSLSMNEVSASTTKSNSKMFNVMEGYNSLKNVLHNSFRKSKSYIREKGKHLSYSLNFSMSNATANPCKQSIADSIPDLDDVLTFNESASISEQIAHTVSFCRKLPVMEISMEMVEAERLLLFSEIRRKNKLTSSRATKTQSMCQKSKIRLFIDDIFLPVASHVNDDIFFNNFYIITFECNGVIKSTQSSECLNGKVMFRDIGMEFLYFSELGTDTMKGKSWTAVKCNIFMLRLRKISNIAIEQKKKTIIETLTKTTAETLKSSSSSSSTSSSTFSEVVSRFRLHASFTIDAKDFVPYEYVHQESVNSDRICIRSSCFCNLPLTTRTKSTNLLREICLKGRAEVRIPKNSFNGFLNVQDPHKHHNWNRRWCTLDGIFLHIWRDESSFSSSPVLSIDLRDSTHNNVPLICSPRELCARPRSFCLESQVNKPSEDITKSLVFFSADTQNNVDDWLKNLNIALDFIAIWLY